MITEDMRERLNLLVSCGHPIIVIGNIVVLPVEADDVFNAEEIEILKAYIMETKKDVSDRAY